MLWVLVVAGIALIALAAAALSYKNLLPGGGESVAGAAEATAAESASVPEPIVELDETAIRDLLATANPGRRAEFLGDAQTFKAFVNQEAARRAVLRAARESGVEDDERVSYLMQRGSEQVLVEAFINAALQGRLSADFPDESQLQETYEANSERFRVEDQIPIWQVFVALPEGGGEAEADAARESAAEIAAEIRSGSLSFAQAATRYSAHEASRANEGFMGVVRPSQLVPAVRERIAELAAGDISDPIPGERGFHIVRRGAITAGRVVGLDEVRDQLRDELRKAAAGQLRQAVIRESVSRFGAPPLADETIEQWRAGLGASSADQ